MKATFAPDAASVLDDLESDPANDRLVDAIWDTIDLITEHPESATARRGQLRSAKGQHMWLAKVPNRHADNPWVVLWQARGDEVLIAYIGPDDFRSGPR